MMTDRSLITTGAIGAALRGELLRDATTCVMLAGIGLSAQQPAVLR
jgi:hypothetical protein